MFVEESFTSHSRIFENPESESPKKSNPESRIQNPESRIIWSGVPDLQIWGTESHPRCLTVKLPQFLIFDSALCCVLCCFSAGNYRLQYGMGVESQDATELLLSQKIFNI